VLIAYKLERCTEKGLPFGIVEFKSPKSCIKALELESHPISESVNLQIELYLTRGKKFSIARANKKQKKKPQPSKHNSKETSLDESKHEILLAKAESSGKNVKRLGKRSSNRAKESQTKIHTSKGSKEASSTKKVVGVNDSGEKSEVQGPPELMGESKGLYRIHELKNLPSWRHKNDTFTVESGSRLIGYQVGYLSHHQNLVFKIESFSSMKRRDVDVLRLVKGRGIVLATRPPTCNMM